MGTALLVLFVWLVIGLVVSLIVGRAMRMMGEDVPVQENRNED